MIIVESRAIFTVAFNLYIKKKDTQSIYELYSSMHNEANQPFLYRLNLKSLRVASMHSVVRVKKQKVF